MARVEHLFTSLVHGFPVREVDEAQSIFDKGFEGCIHGRRGSKRQVLLMEAETLERLRVLPGEVKENVTTRGLDHRAVGEGDRLRIGEAILEVTALATRVRAWTKSAEVFRKNCGANGEFCVAWSMPA